MNVGVSQTGATAALACCILEEAEATPAYVTRDEVPPEAPELAWSHS